VGLVKKESEPLREDKLTGGKTKFESGGLRGSPRDWGDLWSDKNEYGSLRRGWVWRGKGVVGRG